MGVANCHIVIASENATFGITGVRMGLWPFVIFPAVSAAVGERRALALTITAELFNAANRSRGSRRDTHGGRAAAKDQLLETAIRAG
jgi:hypothetical protein